MKGKGGRLPVRILLGRGLAVLAVVFCLAGIRMPRRPTETFRASGAREQSAAVPPAPSGTLRINEADADELISLPGVGETLARAILDERERNGPFRFPEDIMAVKGIGPAKLAQILPYLDLDEEGE